MMSYRPLDELPDIPIAGRQVGDTNLMTADGIVHLPDCKVWQSVVNSEVDPARCSCGAKFAKASEFVERKVGD